ncbi:39S ribosomal protein L48, mitochondrial-like [Pecten maximus]|uniref:39S ribosomal protein L48, mitochondrial-like n=1 Tax=Pecten maximus TaxID=6579 RepID=UPI0014580976|nr:39S ribosomal protein L48, mitochondrial-like [Pecten maximus]
MVTRVVASCLRRIFQQNIPGANNACPRCKQHLQRLQISSTTCVNGVWEPEGLNKRPLIPEYDNISMKMYSYDCAVLESFAKYAKRLAASLDMDVFMYPVPQQTHVIKTYKPYSTIVDNQYTLAKYERVIRIHNLPSTLLPVFIELMRKNIPSGVDIEFKQQTEEDETVRYMADQERKQLLAELDDLTLKKT